MSRENNDVKAKTEKILRCMGGIKSVNKTVNCSYLNAKMPPSNIEKPIYNTERE